MDARSTRSWRGRGSTEKHNRQVAVDLNEDLNWISVAAHKTKPKVSPEVEPGRAPLTNDEGLEGSMSVDGV